MPRLLSKHSARFLIPILIEVIFFPHISFTVWCESPGTSSVGFGTANSHCLVQCVSVMRRSTASDELAFVLYLDVVNLAGPNLVVNKNEMEFFKLLKDFMTDIRLV